MSVEHRMIEVSHRYRHPRDRVFAAWADAEIKRQWFALEFRDGDEWRMEFRVGGSEAYRSSPGAERRVTYDATYHDIVAGERIILTTEVAIDGRPSSVTVNTAQFETTPAGTLITVVEQATFLDGLETADGRVVGITRQLDNLATWLASH